MDSARRDDGHELGSLLVRHLPAVRAYVRLRAGRAFRAKESASDLVQSVCREVLQAGRFEYQGEAAFRRWLMQAAEHKLADRFTHWFGTAKRDLRREVDVAPASEDGALAAELRTFLTPSRHAQGRETLARFEAAFDRLSAEGKEVLLLTRLLGLSAAEVGERMQKKPGAVRTLLWRTLAQLSQYLDEPSDE